MSRKIGIFTHPFRFGYGGFMQAYALQTVLERMGHQVEVVQIRQGYYEPPQGLKALAVYVKRALFKALNLSTTPVFAEKQYNTEWPILTAQVHQFIKDYIHLREVNSFNELKESDYDVLVVGSDQVWRPAYCDVRQFFLQFAEHWKVNRVAYAASFGTSEKEYSEELLSICRPLAQKFDAISVREDSGVGLCRSYFDVAAVHVLDPTLLLKKEDYEEIVNRSSVTPYEDKLFSYILDECQWKKDVVSFVSKKLHIKPFSIKVCGDKRSLSLEERIQPPVEKWLRAFMDAEYVVTDSFHGCVFSIIFHKPFIVCSNKERGVDRFNSLLNLLDLQKRLVVNAKDFDNFITEQFDWTGTDFVLNNMREKSYDYLFSNL